MLMFKKNVIVKLVTRRCVCVFVCVCVCVYERDKDKLGTRKIMEKDLILQFVKVQ